MEELKEKEFRDAYAVEQVKTGIPMQIRMLRMEAERQWNQQELARRAKTSQAAISRVEDPNYGQLNLGTLLKLASAFDVALLVKFVPFSKILNESGDLSPNALSAKPFKSDLENIERWAKDSNEAVTTTGRRTFHSSAPTAEFIKLVQPTQAIQMNLVFEESRPTFHLVRSPLHGPSDVTNERLATA
jgi:transcriptional regulator with XRE-family HTH domain